MGMPSLPEGARSVLRPNFGPPDAVVASFLAPGPAPPEPKLWNDFGNTGRAAIVSLCQDTMQLGKLCYLDIAWCGSAPS